MRGGVKGKRRRGNEGALSYREKQILNLFEKLFFLSQLSRNQLSFLIKIFPALNKILFK
jgi:hypothetical protein